jgi:hypothetical protein
MGYMSPVDYPAAYLYRDQSVVNRPINYSSSVYVLSTDPLVITHEQSASVRAYEQYGTGDTWRDESNIALRGSGRHVPRLGQSG